MFKKKLNYGEAVREKHQQRETKGVQEQRDTRLACSAREKLMMTLGRQNGTGLKQTITFCSQENVLIYRFPKAASDVPNSIERTRTFLLYPVKSRMKYSTLQSWIPQLVHLEIGTIHSKYEFQCFITTHCVTKSNYHISSKYINFYNYTHNITLENSDSSI